MSEQPVNSSLPKPDAEEAALRRHEPQAAADRDSKSPVWDMSQERAFVETLLNQRFNFFLVFFSLVMAGAINAKSAVAFQVVLTLGFVVCFLFALVLRRSQEKLDLILTDLMMDPSHPVTLIDRTSNQRGSRRRIIGVHIPTICCLALAAALIAAWTGLLGAGFALNAG